MQIAASMGAAMPGMVRSMAEGAHAFEKVRVAAIKLGMDADAEAAAFQRYVQERPFTAPELVDGYIARMDRRYRLNAAQRLLGGP
jgi:hypothetical protein